MSTDYFAKLINLMEKLRSPEGCPWDREQTHETLKPMLIEEAYEVLEALDCADSEKLCEELGDLLFQVIFHSRIAEEEGRFDAQEVCRRLYEKMVRRHPHVFGDRSFSDSKELLRNWEDLKAEERAAAGQRVRKQSLLDGVPEKLPAMQTTHQLTSKASRVGFDWSNLREIRHKIDEEFEELERALEKDDEEAVREEIGDLIFTVLNVARFLEIDSETALRRANRKFKKRFRRMERHFDSHGRSLKDLTLDEMEQFWQSNKLGLEKKTSGA